MPRHAVDGEGRQLCHLSWVEMEEGRLIHASHRWYDPETGRLLYEQRLHQQPVALPC